MDLNKHPCNNSICIIGLGTSEKLKLEKSLKEREKEMLPVYQKVFRLFVVVVVVFFFFF